MKHRPTSMKQLALILLGLLLIVISIPAQIPERAEDISPLLIGEIIPDVVLKAPDASDHSMLDILSEKPTVILFYRGGWCPYCNRHLAEIQSVESKIIELGYQIVAISPDSPENLQLSGEKNELHYSLYSDGDGAFMKAVGIAFRRLCFPLPVLIDIPVVVAAEGLGYGVVVFQIEGLRVDE